MNLEQYAIHYVELDPVRGTEMGKTRPAVIVSPNNMNAALDTIVICPITHTIHTMWRSRLPVSCAGQEGEIALDHIRSVSYTRIRRRIDKLPNYAIAELKRRISELYG